MLAVEELAEEHLVLGYGKMIQYQRHRPLHFVTKGKALQSGQIQAIRCLPVFYIQVKALIQSFLSSGTTTYPLCGP